MDRKLVYDIDIESANLSLSLFLKEKGYSANLLTMLRKNANLTKINEEPSYLNTILKKGDRIIVYIPEIKQETSVVPVELDFSVEYEDEDILVINKPSGMPIHPSINNYNNSLANAIMFYYRNEQSPFVFRCINRLDRDTTGLTIVAKNQYSAALLSGQMNSRIIKRKYYAIVENSDKSLLTSGTIDKPIGRRTESTIERMVDEINGEKAITHYKLIKYINDLSLVECELETGRTHQIRVHMKAIGHPLIGDFLYNPDSKIMQRQALHAGEISFYHPVTGKFMEFRVDFPDDFNRIINN